MAANVDLECELIRNLTLEAGFVPPSLRPVGATVQLAQFIIEMIILGSFVLCFIFFKYAHPQRHTFYRLHSRPLWNVLSVALGAVAAGITGSYLWSHELEHGVPCSVQILASSTVVPLLLIPCLLRMYNFYKSEEITQILVAATGTQHKEIKEFEGGAHERAGSVVVGGAAVGLGGGEDGGASEAPSSYFALHRVAGVWHLCSCLCFWRTRKHENTEDKLLRLRAQSSQATLQILMALALTPYLLSGFLFIAHQHGVHCFGCRVLAEGRLIILAEAAVAILLAMVFTYWVRGKQDGFGVLTDIRLSLMLGGTPAAIMYTMEILLGVQGEFSFYMPLEIFLVVFVYFQTLHQCIMASIQSRQTAEAQLRYQMSIAEFEKLVVHPQGPYHASFCKHLEKEHSLESISFLNAVHGFERGFYDAGAKTNAARVKKILSMYVGDDAVLPCNFSSKVTEQLVGRRKDQQPQQHHQWSPKPHWSPKPKSSPLPSQPRPQPSVDMFREAKEELGTMLYRDSFTRFLITPEFREMFAKNNINNIVPSPPVSTGIDNHNDSPVPTGI